MPELYALNRHAAVEEQKRKKKEREERLKNRRGTQQNIYKSGGTQAHTQSAMEKADHLAGLTAEGVTGEILMIMICNLFQWLFQTHYLVQKRDFSKAEQLGIAYKADANGKFPDIHPLNEKGEPDFDQKPYPQDQDINDSGFRAAIRRNGFVPPPNWLEAQYSQGYQYLEQMMGASVLTPAQREILHKNIEETKKEGPRDDLASDRAAQMAAMQAAKAAAPRPAK
ncbi:MAG: hypothetical protein BGO43_11725 [Gammaproteobacteria bacterium 39-13]|nr:hypothetical protein [Gammaproteobacteria bacterium]OJV85293.1 MAG: hypothetical protein BGO43_11725 [Gammaproteobacteria bacterium 39-13]